MKCLWHTRFEVKRSKVKVTDVKYVFLITLICSLQLTAHVGDSLSALFTGERRSTYKANKRSTLDWMNCNIKLLFHSVQNLMCVTLTLEPTSQKTFQMTEK